MKKMVRKQFREWELTEKAMECYCNSDYNFSEVADGYVENVTETFLPDMEAVNEFLESAWDYTEE